MIELAPAHLATVKAILSQHVTGIEVRAFGSRVTGTANQHSDLDLALVADARLDRRTLGNLREAFQESDLPMKIDLVDWHAISKEFQQIIAQAFEVVQVSS